MLTRKIILADDDADMRMVMRRIIARAEGFELVGEAADGEDLMALYESIAPDVVILDVEMPGLTGVECARRIQDKNPRTIIIFATAHESYREAAFEVYAFDYLVKPFRIERVIRTLEMIRQRLGGGEASEPIAQTPRSQDRPLARLMIRSRDGERFISLSDLLLVQRENRETVLYTCDGGRYVTQEALGELEARLPAETFFRCHKSYIINLNWVESVSPYGRWTHIVRLRGTSLDALITHEKYEQMQTMFA